MKEKNGNMYNWVSGTWNPLAGKCPHDCAYCSTHKLMRYPVIQQKYSGPIRIDENAIMKSLGHGKTWFVCAQSDLFAKEVSTSYIHDILSIINWQPNNTYLFQTKNPEGIINYLQWIPKNSIICTTIETNRNYPEFMGNAPDTKYRANAMNQIFGFRKFVTIEPIMDFDLEEMVAMIKACEPEQVNIGANSYSKIKLPEPSKEKLLALISELQKFTLIANKSNLERLLR
jgi:protein gp37